MNKIIEIENVMDGLYLSSFNIAGPIVLHGKLHKKARITLLRDVFSLCVMDHQTTPFGVIEPLRGSIDRVFRRWGIWKNVIIDHPFVFKVPVSSNNGRRQFRHEMDEKLPKILQKLGSRLIYNYRTIPHGQSTTIERADKDLEQEICWRLREEKKPTAETIDYIVKRHNDRLRHRNSKGTNPTLSDILKKNVEDAAYKYNADHGNPEDHPIPIAVFEEILEKETKKHNAQCEQIRDNN